MTEADTQFYQISKYTAYEYSALCWLPAAKIRDTGWHFVKILAPAPVCCRAADALMYSWWFLFCNDICHVRPIISKSTRPIFTKFSRLVELELWLEMISLKWVFRSLKRRCRCNRFLLAISAHLSSGYIHHMALAYGKISFVHAGRWTQAASGAARRVNVRLCLASSLLL